MEKRIFETKFEAVEIDRDAKKVHFIFKEVSGEIVQINLPIIALVGLEDRIHETRKKVGIGPEELKKIWQENDGEALKKLIEDNGGEWEEC